MPEFVIALKASDKAKHNFITILLILISTVLSAMIVWKGMALGFGILGVVIGLPLIITCILYPHYGYVIAFFISSFVFLAKRFIDLPLGIIPELLMLSNLLGLILKRKKLIEDKSIFKNPISIVISIWVVFMIIQVFNPNALSIGGWVFGFRGVVNLVVYYIVAYYTFSQLKNLHAFLKIWLIIALLAAFYGLYQEFAGLPPYDLAWVTSTKELIGLNFIQGRWRKWSFLSDCTAFGIFMAISAIFCFILTLGPYNKRKRIFLCMSGLVMLVSMSYSGTRTAYAMIPAGFLMYGLLTLNKPSTILFGALSAILFIFILFAPIYNPTINRIRTTFTPSQDASMNVRDFNRTRIQPYIYSHPIGGGVSSTGDNGVKFSPHHFLAGFPPDSGYLQVALETGWVGLVLTFAIYITVLLKAVNNFYKIKDPQGRNLLAALISVFFSLTIAYYTQVSITQLPANFIFYAIYVLAYKFPDLFPSHGKA